MSQDPVPSKRIQDTITDKFFYFFLGLRKGEIRRRVGRLTEQHPDESTEQLARRLVAAQTPLSLVGGLLLHAPLFLPGGAPAIKLLGVAGGASVMMRMHMSLMLEIALLFGHDIDEQARLKEMAVIMAATGLVSATPLLTKELTMNGYAALLTGAMSVSSFSSLIGEAAILYYMRKAKPYPASSEAEVAHAG